MRSEQRARSCILPPLQLPNSCQPHLLPESPRIVESYLCRSMVKLLRSMRRFAASSYGLLVELQRAQKRRVNEAPSVTNLTFLMNFLVSLERKKKTLYLPPPVPVTSKTTTKISPIVKTRCAKTRMNPSSHYDHSSASRRCHRQIVNPLPLHLPLAAVLLWASSRVCGRPCCCAFAVSVLFWASSRGRGRPCCFCACFSSPLFPLPLPFNSRAL